MNTVTQLTKTKSLTNLIQVKKELDALVQVIDVASINIYIGGKVYIQEFDYANENKRYETYQSIIHNYRDYYRCYIEGNRIVYPVYMWDKDFTKIIKTIYYKVTMTDKTEYYFGMEVPPDNTLT